MTYLRDHEPSEYLDDAAVAPLAVLGRAPSAEARADVLRQVFEVVAGVDNAERRIELADVAVVLAAIHLDPTTIENLAREADMPITLRGTYGGRILEAEAEARGRSEGRSEGRTEAKAELLRHLLRRSFGDDARIDSVAARLAELSHEAAVEAALTARSLDELAARYA